jgi:hypothetical protein
MAYRDSKELRSHIGFSKSGYLTQPTGTGVGHGSKKKVRKPKARENVTETASFKVPVGQCVRLAKTIADTTQVKAELRSWFLGPSSRSARKLLHYENAAAAFSLPKRRATSFSKRRMMVTCILSASSKR